MQYTTQEIKVILTPYEIDLILNGVITQSKYFKKEMPGYDTSDRDKLIEKLFNLNPFSVILK